MTFSYWDGHYPDDANNVITSPAVAAELDLESVTTSGTLDFAFIRARVAGAGGNDISVRFLAFALIPEAGAAPVVVSEDLIADPKEVTVAFWPGVATVLQVKAALDVDSTLVELAGSYNPSDVLVATADEFGFSLLTDGADEAFGERVTHWGPHYPMLSAGIPIERDVPRNGPSVAAILGIQLESGLTVSYEWVTVIHKAENGLERRGCRLRDPRVTYNGSAYLLKDSARSLLADLATYATSGQPFGLALPYEAITITEDGASSDTIPVFSTETADWANPGQPIIAVSPSGERTTPELVVQSVNPTSLVVDQAPDPDVAVYPSKVMPVVPVLLDMRQGFARFSHPEEGVERLELQAESYSFGFPVSAVQASVAGASDPRIAQFATVSFVAVAIGSAGNGIDITIQPASGLGSTVEIDEAPDQVLIEFEEGVATFADLDAAINGTSAVIGMFGQWTPEDVIATGLGDLFEGTTSGGSDAGYVEPGIGADMTTFDGTLIWDKKIDAPDGGTIDDALMSMANIVDLGATRRSIGRALVPEWGRTVSLINKPLDADHFQWLKRFLHTVRGSWKSWFLPTWRSDLVAVGNGPGGGGTTGQLTIDASVGSFYTWYGSGFTGSRTMIQVEQGEDVYHLEISNPVLDNDANTITFDVRSDASKTVPAALPIDRISWLERCRFEKDRLTVGIKDNHFTFTELGRAVAR